MHENIYIINLHNGDEGTFRAIFETHRTRLCYFACQILPDGESPEDVVQEAFAKLWEKRRHFHQPDAIKAFLYITVKNRCLNLCKHDKVVRKYGDLLHAETDEQAIGDHIMESEVLENVYRALERLPEGCRQVLKLSYFQELRNKDIAEKLQVSINTVKTQKKRALHLLRAVLRVTSLWGILSAAYLF